MWQVEIQSLRNGRWVPVSVPDTYRNAQSLMHAGQVRAPYRVFRLAHVDR